METFKETLVAGVELEIEFAEDSAFVDVRNRSVNPLFVFTKDDAEYNTIPIVLLKGERFARPIVTDAIKCLSAQGGDVEAISVPASEYSGVGPAGNDGNDGNDGADGADAFVYIAYASDASGTGFTTTFDANLNYIAILATDTEIVTPVAGDFAGLWKNYKGATGSQGEAASLDEYIVLARKFSVSRQADCSSAIPNNTDTAGYVVVTTAGNGAVIGDILSDDGSETGQMQIISALHGYRVASTVALTGGTIEFNALSTYRWNVNQWVLFSYDSGNQTVSNNGELTLAHGLGDVPMNIMYLLKCINEAGANGWALGDELPVALGNTYAISKSAQVKIDATNIIVHFAATASPFSILNKSSGTHETASVSDWKLIVRARL